MPKQSLLKQRLKARIYGAVTDQKTLGIGNIYVFFSRQGSLFALLLLITFVMGVNYGNNLILGFFFYLSSIWLISVFISFSHLAKLTLTVKDIPPVEAGSHAKIEVCIQNQGNTARQIRVGFSEQTLEHDVKQSKERQGADLPYHHTEPFVGDDAVISVYLKTQKRGVYPLPRIVISTIYPLGIVKAWSYALFAKKIAVYPAPLPFDMMVFGSGGTLSTTAHIKGQEEFSGLNVYEEGESLARVSWRHLASGQGMLTKQFTDPVGQAWVVDYALMPSSSHEEKLGNLSYLLLLLKQENKPFIFRLPSGSWQGSGVLFVHDCLRRLASVEQGI